MSVPLPELLAALRVRFDARAAGCWRVAAGRLEQAAFSAADDLPAAVALAFAESTRSVPLAATDLGIVRAVVSDSVVVSRAADLPPDSGSGVWLRRFNAARSVAVPVRDDAGAVALVVALALADVFPDDATVADAIRSEAAGWLA